jgi:aryl-alcohol dehydrogenase-like predicted oxidoreductase
MPAGCKSTLVAIGASRPRRSSFCVLAHTFRRPGKSNERVRDRKIAPSGGGPRLSRTTTVILSNVTREHIERARKIVPIVSVQNRYSFADREWDYVVDHCERNGIAFIPWFPLGAGKVAGEILNRVAKAHQSTPLQVALAWLLQRSPVMLPFRGLLRWSTWRKTFRRLRCG